MGEICPQTFLEAHVFCIWISVSCLLHATSLLLPTLMRPLPCIMIYARLNNLYNCNVSTIVCTVLTSNIDIKWMVHWISNSIVCCTAVCSSNSSIDVYNNPRVSNEHYLTICTIQQYSGPGDTWCWFTSRVTKQSKIWTFFDSLVTTGTAGKTGFN